MRLNTSECHSYECQSKEKHYAECSKCLKSVEVLHSVYHSCISNLDWTCGKCNKKLPGDPYTKFAAGGISENELRDAIASNPSILKTRYSGKRYSINEAARMVGISKKELVFWLDEGKVVQPTVDYYGFKTFSRVDVKSILEFKNKLLRKQKSKDSEKKVKLVKKKSLRKEDEVDESENLIEINELYLPGDKIIKFYIKNYNGKRQGHIRKFIKFGGYFGPSKQGVTLSRIDLINIVNDLKKYKIRHEVYDEREITAVERKNNQKVVVAVREYQGKKGIDIRTYVNWPNYSGPTKRGVRIPLSEFDNLLLFLNKMINRFD